MSTMLSSALASRPVDRLGSVSLVTVSCLTLWGIVHYYHGRQPSRRNTRLPPGPRGYPIIGSLIEILSAKQLPLLFPEWTRKYGNMFMFTVLGTRTLVLTDYQTAVDLLEKRSAIYSDRPPLILFTELGGWGRAMPVLRYGPLFRKHRRLSQAHFNVNAVWAYGSMHAELSRKLVSSIEADPERFREHIFTYATETIFRIAYDLDVVSPESRHLIAASTEAIRKSAETLVTGAIVNFLPSIKWVYKWYPEWAPFAGFKRRVVNLRREVESAKWTPFNMTKDNIRSGSAGKSIVHDAIRDAGGIDGVSKEDEEDICGLAGILYAAGQETTIAAVTAFVLNMVLNPDVQRKAQEEIDTNIASDRPLTLDDRPDLPYLEAILKELYRWTVPIARGVPHAVIQDDIYNDYFIPKDTVIITSLVDMCNDCPRPAEFLPHRFIDGTDRGNVPAHPGDIIFGFGRRRCPGVYIADNSIWTVIAQMLASFDFLSEIVNGKECPPRAEFEEVSTRHLAPFKCRILPRKGRRFVVPSD